MANDEKIESAAYKAITDLLAMPWPVQKERIVKNIVRAIMIKMNWTHIRLEGDNAEITKDS